MPVLLDFLKQPNNVNFRSLYRIIDMKWEITIPLITLHLGSYQLYVFHNPLDKASKSSSPKDSQDVIDWEFAQRELALATGIDGLDYKPKSREDLILQKELLELIPMVTEVNAISEELNKQRAFDILLIPPTAQGLLYGEPRTTKTMVRMRDLTTNAVWLWGREKFLGRRFLMQEMYQHYLNKGQDVNIPKEEDPYWEVLEDRLLGVAPAFLQALGYRLDVDDKLAVTSIEGEEVGTLSFQLIPCTRSGKPWSELDASGSGHGDFVDDPNELLGQPFHFKEFSSVVRSVQASRRYSRVQAEEYCDVNRLKTELTLIQRSLDRHVAVGEQLRDLCEVWSKKKPTNCRDQKYNTPPDQKPFSARCYSFIEGRMTLEVSRRSRTFRGRLTVRLSDKVCPRLFPDDKLIPVLFTLADLSRWMHVKLTGYIPNTNR
ncbi:hypothetical protein P879_03451 [Paragonimus westermani]|uniref:Kinesin-like KIF1-type domain-containing protein n=1 Tax=Paragonimus westermani TaxID=34504 RepID=A0A8T0DSY1_9TREM|nr:hypothetical protein P879_03451 [Paragonimus westermani]